MGSWACWAQNRKVCLIDRFKSFINSVWPDLAIFGKILKVFGHFLKFNLVFGKILNLLRQFFNATYRGKIHCKLPNIEQIILPSVHNAYRQSSTLSDNRRERVKKRNDKIGKNITSSHFTSVIFWTRFLLQPKSWVSSF